MIDWTRPHSADVDAHHNESHTADKHTDVARELFVGPNPSAVDHSFYEKYSVIKTVANSGTNVLFTFRIPDDFVSLTHIHVVVLEEPGESTVVWDFLCQYAANGEDRNTHSGSSAGNQTALTAGVITELDDKSGLFSSLAAGDYIGVRWKRDGASGSDTAGWVDCLGLLMEYTAEQ